MRTLGNPPKVTGRSLTCGGDGPGYCRYAVGVHESTVTPPPPEAPTAWWEPRLGNGERTEGELDEADRGPEGLTKPSFLL